MFGQRQAMHETIMEMKLNFHSYESEFICPFICHSYGVNHSEGDNYCYKHFILTGLLEGRCKHGFKHRRCVMFVKE